MAGPVVNSLPSPERTEVLEEKTRLDDSQPGKLSLALSPGLATRGLHDEADQDIRVGASPEHYRRINLA